MKLLASLVVLGWVAACSGVQLEHNPFKRLIPADVLRGETRQIVRERLSAILNV
jgi:hypothetical protein